MRRSVLSAAPRNSQKGDFASASVSVTAAAVAASASAVTAAAVAASASAVAAAAVAVAASASAVTAAAVAVAASASVVAAAAVAASDPSSSPFAARHLGSASDTSTAALSGVAAASSSSIAAEDSSVTPLASTLAAGEKQAALLLEERTCCACCCFSTSAAGANGEFSEKRILESGKVQLIPISVSSNSDGQVSLCLLDSGCKVDLFTKDSAQRCNLPAMSTIPEAGLLTGTGGRMQRLGLLESTSDLILVSSMMIGILCLRVMHNKLILALPYVTQWWPCRCGSGALWRLFHMESLGRSNSWHL
ncbi:antifreeze protein Maxi-like [Cyclospora cayetanensis]|uniref:Antifreeze protein Maxi-like n=1 Tax=Cyclospora cayetanensis TaxID=88456 RepID=A0A6P6RZ22_9EIME|nr:antifreeze protein Maxi-like [Cyclospora cayetanensis]